MVILQCKMHSCISNKLHRCNVWQCSFYGCDIYIVQQVVSLYNSLVTSPCHICSIWYGFHSTFICVMNITAQSPDSRVCYKINFAFSLVIVHSGNMLKYRSLWSSLTSLYVCSPLFFLQTYSSNFCIKLS